MNHSRAHHFLLLSLMAAMGLLWGCGPSREERAALACERGAAFLSLLQREDGAIADSSDALFDVWETALASAALAEADAEGASLQRALAFLQENEDSAGMVCHNVKCRRAYCLETTAEYFLLLHHLGKSDMVLARLDTILALQQPTGEWHIGNPDVMERTSFPSVTAFVLALLLEMKVAPQHEMEAHAWLRSQQTDEGHWGMAWEYYECPAYALWPVMRSLGNSIGDEKARKRAVEYMRTSQLPDGSWNHRVEGRGRLPSAELQTALMLSALQAAPVSAEDETLLHGIDFLLDHQREDGSWEGGFFPVEEKRRPKEEYVIATARAICVLNQWKEAR